LQYINPVGGNQITQSIYAKPLGRSVLTMRWSGTTWGKAWFDLINQEVTTEGGTNVTGASIEDLDNGWFHCSVTYDRTIHNVQFFFGVSEAVGTTHYIGSGIEAMGIYGAEAYNPTLLGQPLGQLFFSPALDTAVLADSTIQVDSASVCTRAYDVYEVPSLPDPHPLMTWGDNLPYNASVLNDSADVLFATAERLGQARINLGDFREDTWGGATDGPADATLQETFDQTKVSLLNVDDWVLYDGVNPSFICADNLAPIGPGATTNINLQP
jgi:hypothetical protein